MTQAEAVLNTGFEMHLAVHGETATFTPAGGTASSIQVIFDEAAEVADPQTGILTTAPQARTWSANAPSADRGRLVARGVTYNILLAKEDGFGVTHMMLSRNTEIPVAPSGLSVINEGGKPRLNWTRNATNNTAVEVWRQLLGDWFYLTTLADNAVTYLDTSAASGFAYSYRVRNTNQSGPSPDSNVAGPITPP